MFICVYEFTVYYCFIFRCIVAVFSFFAAAVSFFCRENAPRRLFYITCSRPAPWSFFTIMKCFCTTCEALYTTVRMAPQAAGFCRSGRIDLLLAQKYELLQSNSCLLGCVRLWKPGQSFILAWFTLSLPRSAPCGTEQTTIDTGCDLALPCNCVDHPADCNLFITTTLLNSH